MHEPATTLTDYVLCLQCAWFAVAIGRRPTRSLLGTAFTVLFASVAMASAAGGTVHGFFAEPSTAREALWSLTLLSIGVTAAAMLVVAVRLGLPDRPGRVLVAVAAWSVYAAIVLLVSTSFAVAIAASLPTALLLAVVLLARRELAGAGAGLAGVVLALLGAAGQQAGIGLHPRYFDHNAVYHVVQMAALYLLYRCAVGLCGERA